MGRADALGTSVSELSVELKAEIAAAKDASKAALETEAATALDRHSATESRLDTRCHELDQVQQTAGMHTKHDLVQVGARLGIPNTVRV